VFRAGFAQNSVRKEEEAKGNEMAFKDEAQKMLDQLNSGASESGTEWTLLRLDESAGRALVIAKECVAKMPYHEPGGAATWEQCTLRGWLNSDFYEGLPADVRSRVIQSENANADNCVVSGGNNTKDFVFLLSIDDYNTVLPEALRIAHFHGPVSWWWLRSPGYDAFQAANVNRVGRLDGGFDARGGFKGHGYYLSSPSGGVRPAFFLNLNS
jgi:hypothetical protein